MKAESDNLHECIIKIYEKYKQTDKKEYHITINKEEKIDNNRIALFVKILKNLQEKYDLDIKINFQ